MENQQSSKIRVSISQVCDTISVIYTLYETVDNGRTYYSVKADMNDETATASDITGDPVYAELIFDMVVRGGVTPCCICEVIEDLIESVSTDRTSLSDHRFPGI